MIRILQRKGVASAVAVLLFAPAAWASVCTVASGETVKVTDSTVADFRDGFAFADATGTVEFDTSAAPTMLITGAGTVRKTSTADWTSSTAIEGFTGDYVLEGGGTVSVSVSKTFGSLEGGSLHVKGGTTLRVLSADVNFKSRALYLSGTGVDSQGALHVVSGVSAGTSFSKYLRLEDDARVVVGGNPSGVGSTQFYTMSGDIYLNGHTITKAGTGGWYLYMTSVQDAGTIQVEGAADGSTSGYLCVRQWTKLGTAGKLTVRAKNKVTLDFWDGESSTQACDLEVDGELTLCRGYGGVAWTTKYANWSGPIRFADAASKIIVNISNSADFYTFSGPVSGPGSIFFASGGTFCLSCTENSYTGLTTYDASAKGMFLIPSAAALPDYSKVVVKNGTLRVPLDAEGVLWPPSSALALLDKADVSAKGAIAFDTRGLDETPYVVTAEAVASSLTREPVPLAIGGTNVAQTVCWKGATPLAYGFVGEGGTWLLDGGADVTVAFDRDSPFRLGTVAGQTSRVIVSNACFHSAGIHRDSSASILTNAVAIGCTSGANGILELGEGAVVSNKISLGAATGAFGALYQRGGASVLYGDLLDDTYQKTAPLGAIDGGGGYLELSGGTMTFAGQMAIGLAGNGVFVQKGGSFVHTNHVADADGTVMSYVGIPQSVGKAEMYVEDGTMSVRKFLFNRVAGFGQLTVKGGEVKTASSFGVACSTWGGLGYANLNGGILATEGFCMFRSNYTTVGHFFLNFGGGTLRCTASGKDIFGSGLHFDRVTVYAGGATVDTAGLTGLCSTTPFESPSGKGVGSIPWTPKSGYAGSPIVQITGDGSGATAHAVFDSRTGMITALEVTSPGCDYLTATATVTCANTVLATIVLDDFLVDNVTTGSFTKAGAGIFTLKAVNTYGGDTVLRGGVLKCDVDGAIPGDSTFVLAGGGWDMNGKALSGGAAAPTKFAIDLAGVIERGAPTCETALAFVAGSTLEIRHSERAKAGESYVLLNLANGYTGPVPALTGSLAASGVWKLRGRNGALALCYRKGLSLIVR